MFPSLLPLRSAAAFYALTVSMVTVVAQTGAVPRWP